MREIALFAGAMQLSNKIPFILANLRGLMPFAARAVLFGNAFYGFHWDSWLYTAIDLYTHSMRVYFNYLFVFGGLVDFSRRKITL